MAASIPTRTTLPGPRPMPVLGWRGNSLPFYRDPLGYLCQLYRSYGPIAALTRDNPTVVCLFGPQYNHQLLSDTDLFYTNSFEHIPIPRSSTVQYLRSGLILMNGAQHRQQRRLMLPAFHKKQVETYRDEIVAIVQQILDSWPLGRPINVAQTMRQLTLEVALKTLFGLDGGQEAHQLASRLQHLLRMLMSPSLVLLPFELPGTPYWRAMRIGEQVVEYFRKLIQRKRTTSSDRSDVLSLLIHARDEDGTVMSDRELIGHAYTLFFAGHETSSNALTWTLFLLAQHPPILASLLDELEGMLRGDAPSVEQLSRLPLLERVIKESMRLLPPAALGTRKAMGPVEIGGRSLPDGASFIYSQYVTHHMPELYTEPERFWPDRWISIDPSPYEYLPFGAGARMCIGAAFAMTEIKIALAMILQRYRLTLVPGAKIDRQMLATLGPKHGMPMVVAAQDRRFERSEIRGNIHDMVDLHS